MSRYVWVLALAAASPLLFAVVSFREGWDYDWRHGTIIAFFIAGWVVIDARDHRDPRLRRWVVLSALVVGLWASFTATAVIRG